MAALDFVTLSYCNPQLFRPEMFKGRQQGAQDNQNQQRFYSTVILVPYTDGAHDVTWSPFYSQNPDVLKKLAEQMTELQQAGFELLKQNMSKLSEQQVWQAVQNKQVMWPFHNTSDPSLNTRTDGTEKADSTRFEFSMNARRYESQGAPTLLDRYPDNPPKYNAKGKVQPRAILVPEEGKLYAGCIAKVDVSIFWTSKGAKPGLGLGLNAVQHWADGPRLDGRVMREFEADTDVPEGEGMDPGAAPAKDPGFQPATGPKAAEVRQFFPNFGGRAA